MAANSFDGEEKMSIDEKVPADGGLYDFLHKSDEALIDEKVPARGSLHDSFLKTEMPIEHKRENVRGRMAYILGGTLAGIVVIGGLKLLLAGNTSLQDWSGFTSPIIAMIASMTGYYYGQGKERR